MTENRQRMEPILFETLIFLKMNRTYWDLDAVQTPMARCENASRQD